MLRSHHRYDTEIAASPRNIGIYMILFEHNCNNLKMAETCSYFFAIKYHHKTYHYICVSWMKFTSPLVFLHTTGITHLRFTIHIVCSDVTRGCNFVWNRLWTMQHLVVAFFFLYYVTWSRYRPVLPQRVGKGIALLFHDRGTRRGWVVSSTPRPHFTPRKDPVHILQEAAWAPGPVWTGGKSRPHRDSIPDRPACSQSQYRLSYRAPPSSCVTAGKLMSMLIEDLRG